MTALWLKRAGWWGGYLLVWWLAQQIAVWFVGLFTFPFIEPRIFDVLRIFMAVGLLVPVVALIIGDISRVLVHQTPTNHAVSGISTLTVIALLLIFLQLIMLLALNTLWWRDLIVRKDFGAVQWVGLSLSNADFSGANFTEATLTSGNFSGSDFTGANLVGTDLNGANFSGATFINADLRGADLRGANLSGANLATANLRLANLNGANLSGSNLFQVDFTEADLRTADLNRANLVQVLLLDADLRGATLRDTIIPDLSVLETALLNERTIMPDGTRYTP